MANGSDFINDSNREGTGPFRCSIPPAEFMPAILKKPGWLTQMHEAAAKGRNWLEPTACSALVASGSMCDQLWPHFNRVYGGPDNLIIPYSYYEPELPAPNGAYLDLAVAAVHDADLKVQILMIKRAPLITTYDGTMIPDMKNAKTHTPDGKPYFAIVSADDDDHKMVLDENYSWPVPFMSIVRNTPSYIFECSSRMTPFPRIVPDIVLRAERLAERIVAEKNYATTTDDANYYCPLDNIPLITPEGLRPRIAAIYHAGGQEHIVFENIMPPTVCHYN